MFHVEGTLCTKTRKQSGTQCTKGIDRPGWVEYPSRDLLGKMSPGKKIITFLGGNNYTLYWKEELLFSSYV